jgi:hypothetical protein
LPWLPHGGHQLLWYFDPWAKLTATKTKWEQNNNHKKNKQVKENKRKKKQYFWSSSIQ